MSTANSLLLLGPVGFLVETLVNTMAKEDDPAHKKKIEELRIYAESQELESRIAESRAKVAQELAIASRISTADEVTMEEFYDYSGEASAGISAKKETINIGASAQGRKVVKRILRFKGSHGSLVFNEEDTPCDET